MRICVTLYICVYVPHVHASGLRICCASEFLKFLIDTSIVLCPSDILLQVDAALAVSGGPYFLGDDVTIVDLMFAPFLERMAASLPYYKGFEVRCSK
jgi:hypothetical protein